MLTTKELERRARMPRPDPQKKPCEYQRWMYARKCLGRAWKVSEMLGRSKPPVRE